MIDNDATPPPASSVTNKREAQMKKLKDANTKYKDLLKMAKGRIQAQEEELESLKGEFLLLPILDPALHVSHLIGISTYDKYSCFEGGGTESSCGRTK
jgi:hypothetical protein